MMGEERSTCDSIWEEEGKGYTCAEKSNGNEANLAIVRLVERLVSTLVFWKMAVLENGSRRYDFASPWSLPGLFS